MQANGDQVHIMADVCEITFTMNNQNFLIHITLSFIIVHVVYVNRSLLHTCTNHTEP